MKHCSSKKITIIFVVMWLTAAILALAMYGLLFYILLKLAIHPW